VYIDFKFSGEIAAVFFLIDSGRGKNASASLGGTEVSWI
jgi:hypothetical protein